MSDLAHPLRVELTILDPKLYREEIKFFTQPVPHLLYCTPFKDAVSPPFPRSGKAGVSIFVGRREQFRQPEVPILWALEKKRGRPRIAVVTNLRGKDFAPAYRELESSLIESQLCPLSFLRRREKMWDSLDFFSSGSSPSMQGAAPRLKRLKQRGWENLVDRLSLVDDEIREQYFEELHVERALLQDALVRNFVEMKVATMVAIAGQCLQKQHFPFLLREAMNARLLTAFYREFAPAIEEQHWIYLGKREAARELLFLSVGERWVKKGEVLVGDNTGEERAGELLVEEIKQRLQLNVGSTVHTVIRVQVEWRYRPLREIPVFWKQNSTSMAGSSPPDG